MQGSGSGLYFGWAPGGGTTGDSEHTEVSTVTTFDPVPFDLEDLPGSSFTFGATKDVTTTYHPTGADGPGYYPVRGTVTYAFSASLTVEFLG